MRRKLIKNNNKVNIRERTRSRPFKSNKKPSKIIKNNNFKRRIILRKKEDIINQNLKNIRYNSKEIIRKRVSFSKDIRKRYSSKGKLKKQNLYDKINSYSNNINNTIDDVNLPNKLKMHFNLHKINISYFNNSKKALSVARQNMKLASFELSKLKKETKKFEIFYRNNTDSNKRNNRNFSNNRNQNRKKFNLFYRDYLKEIKISSKKNNKYLENEYKNKILKTEISKEKEKNILDMKGIKKMKLPNIKTETINNANANIIIIDNTKEEENKNNDKIINNYNAKTNVKISNNNTIFKKVKESNSSGNSEYIIKTFDKDKNYYFKKQNLNKYNRISVNQNMNNLKKIEHKNTIGEKEDKNLGIKLDISTNLGCTQKNNNYSTFTNKDKNQSKKKMNKNENKTTIIKDIEMPKKDNLNIETDLNNNKKSFITYKNNIFKDLEHSLNTESRKNPTKTNKNNLNKNEKGSKNKISHKKLVPNNPIKISNHRKNQKNNKKQNIPKILNKTSNSSNFNSFIKNPFIPTEPTTYNTNNHSITNTSIIPRGTSNKKINNNKHSQKTLKNNKKPYVTIRNTVINFNMIDTGLILESLNKKKKGKKRISKIDQNNSFSKLHNNHLFRLCNKYNNNLIQNINNSNIHGDISIKIKTINVNNNLQFNSKKNNYGDKVIKCFKKNNNKYISEHDKFHMKFNSMRLEDIHGLKKNKKNIIKINTNSNIINNDNYLINAGKSHYNTINNEGIASREKRKNFLNKNRKK